MPSNHQLEFPVPRDWQEFQRMTCDLFRKLWRNRHAQEFGTQGARQHGVDVFGASGKKKRIEGVQCKRTVKLTADEVREEYKKSRSFRPKLSRFILATTAKRSTEAQQAAAELTLAGTYPCDLLFWEDFCEKLGRYPKLIHKHYPQFVVVQMLGDAASKLVQLDVDTDHFEMMLTAILEKETYYGGTILVSDLLSRKCETYRLGDHYSRLEGVVGNRWRAFVVSKWLNRFKSAEDLMRLGKEVLSFSLSEEERREGMKLGLAL
jgi:hypothetical protein